jgi:hypothetical protein
VADADVARILAAHPVVWNSVFATIQVTLGLGLLWRRSATVARFASVGWALGVWVVGEGFGGLFMDGASLVNGAPGAALIYAVCAVVLWPAPSDRDHHSVASSGRFGERAALTAWTLLWCGTALLEFEKANHLAVVPGAELRNIGYGEPGLLERLNIAAGHLVGHQGQTFAIVLGLAAAFAGVGAQFPSARRPALAVGMAIAAFVGVVGQDLGGVFTGQGTDPGSGPLLILLALTLWPAVELTRTYVAPATAGPLTAQPIRL